jgi:hypothetical protein
MIRELKAAAVALVAVAASGLGSAAGATPVRTHVAMAHTSSAGDPVIAAAGDIACDPSDSGWNGGKGTSSRCKEMATSDMILAEPSIDAVLALGDNQYQCGGYRAYLQSFDPSWGRFKAEIHPVPGDNEYETSGTDCASGGAGYFTYFGAVAGNAQGDYAWTLGSWRLIALNAECSHAGGCGSGTVQANFLKNQLGSATCTLVYWHQPYYKGTTRRASNYSYFWHTLYSGGADLVLNGHLHNYSRFAPQDADGNVDDARGVRQFIVGTGGKNLFSLDGTRNVQFTTKAFGILELTLHPTSYDWTFVATSGKTLDTGSASCH